MALATLSASCLRRTHDQPKKTTAMKSSTTGCCSSGTSWKAKSKNPSTPTNVISTPRYAKPWSAISDETASHAFPKRITT